MSSPFRVALVAMALIAALGSLPASARGGGGGFHGGDSGGLQSRFRRPRLQPWLLRATLRIQSWFRRTALRLFWPSGLCRTSCVCRPGLRCAAAVVGVGTATAVVGVGAAAAMVGTSPLVKGHESTFLRQTHVRMALGPVAHPPLSTVTCCTSSRARRNEGVDLGVVLSGYR